MTQVAEKVTIELIHLNRFLKATAGRRTGFTIVELLIVIVVIAILAAITIVAYNGITRQAVEASMMSDLNSAAKTIEVEKTTTNSYPADGVSLKSSQGNQLSYKLTDGVFCVSVSSTKSTKQFRITSSNGQIEEAKCAPLLTATTTARSVPTAVNTAGVLSGKTPTAVSAGTYHSCAIASNESYCWGWSVYGNIGDGTTSTTRLTAVPVLALP